LDRHKLEEHLVRVEEVRSVDLPSEEARLLLRLEVLASRPRRLRLGKPKPRRRSVPVVVRPLSVQQMRLVALDRPQERLLLAPLVAAEVRSANRHLLKVGLGVVPVRERLEGLEEAEVHSVVEAKVADYLAAVVALHSKLHHLELQRNRGRCLGNKINLQLLVNLHKVPVLARLNNNNNLDRCSAQSQLHLLVDYLGAHRNKQVVEVACLDPRERRLEVAVLLAAQRHRSLRHQVLVDLEVRKGSSSSNSSKMLSASRHLPGEGAVCLERSKVRAAARPLVVNNLGSDLRRKRRQVSVLRSSNKPVRFSVRNLRKHQEVFLVELHHRHQVLSLEEERKLHRRAVKAALALHHLQELVDFLVRRSLRRRRLVAVRNNRALAVYLGQLELARLADRPYLAAKRPRKEQVAASLAAGVLKREGQAYLHQSHQLE
jgi:hypothetical protein